MADPGFDFNARMADTKEAMSPIAHFMTSWLIGASVCDDRRDVRLIALAGVAPDLDGLGVVADIAARLSGHEAPGWFERYHHVLLHGLAGCVVIVIAMACFARRHPVVVIGAILAFHMHLACDLVGSRGPTPGEIWPIHYLSPFSAEPVWLWKHQWALDAWQNQVYAAAAMALCLVFSVRNGQSPVAVFSQQADVVVVRVLRDWAERLGFGKRRAVSEPDGPP